MSLETQFQREMDALSEALACGDITRAEYDERMHDLELDYWDARQEAAQAAYDRELEDW